MLWDTFRADPEYFQPFDFSSASQLSCLYASCYTINFCHPVLKDKCCSHLLVDAVVEYWKYQRKMMAIIATTTTARHLGLYFVGVLTTFDR